MTERIRPDNDFIEKIIIKGILNDKTFSILVSNQYIKEFFINDSASRIFEEVRLHLDEFKQIPPKDLLLNTIGDSIKDYFDDIDQIDFDISRQYDYLLEESNIYLKDAAIKKAMIDNISIIDNQEDLEQIRQNIEAALCRDLKVDLGLEYFRDLGTRLHRIFTTTERRIKTYFPTFDEYINGGFPPLTLSVIVAKIHGFKSNTMANFAARQVLHGHNVALLSLEMSQDMFAQRFDAILSLMDINRMYFNGHRRELMTKLKHIKDNQEHGKLYIKQYPTGAASVRDFKTYLRELKMRDENPEIIYVDYINLMKPAMKQHGDNMYLSVKTIAEELRALSFEFEIPVVSVSQLNREGSFVGLEEVDFNYISESHGVPATADFMSIFGTNPDAMIYQSELHNKIVKNRLGGRVGDIIKMYYDQKNLKMYDQEEEDLWLSEAQTSGDERSFFTPPEPPRPRRRRRNNNDQGDPNAE